MTKYLELLKVLAEGVAKIFHQQMWDERKFWHGRRKHTFSASAVTSQ
jgi:hypothetical protein